MKRATLGIDIGGTFVKSALVSDSNEILARREDPVERGSVDGLVAEIVSVVRALDPAASARAAGVAIAGLVESASGRVTASPHLPGLNDFDAAGAFSRALGRPVVVLNDATAAALGEAAAGAGRGHRNVLMFTAGTGVGGGLVFDGHPYEGTHGFAGEIGHLPIDEVGDPCACGRFGCLETAAGATYLVARARAAIEQGVPTSLAAFGADLTGKDIFDACRAGDSLAARIVERAGKALGRSSAIALQLLDLDRVIVGGGLARSADLLLPQIIREAQARTFPQIFERATFATAELGHWAGALGVARAAALRFAPTISRTS